MTPPLQPPESKEGKEKSTNEALAEDFTAALLVSEERRAEITKNLTEILDKGKIETASDHALVKNWIKAATQLNLEAARCKTNTSLTNSEISARLGKKAQEFFAAREEVLASLLEMLDKRNGTGAATFIERPSSDTTIDEEISDIEDEVYSYIDPSNRLHKHGKTALPNFKRIDDWRKKIYEAKQLVVKKPSPERSATLARLDRLEMSLDTIMSMDPIGRMRSLPENGAYNLKRLKCDQTYACAEKLGLIGKDGKLNIAPHGTMPAEEHRDPIMLGARAAGLGLFAILFLLSAITTGKKLLKGDGLSHSDALTAAYGVGTLALAGVDILPSKPSEVEALNKLLSIRNDPQCKSAIAKMGGNKKAAEVVNNFHDLVSNSTDREEIWAILRNPIALKASRFKEYTKGSGSLHTALKNVEGETEEAKKDQKNLKHFLITLKNNGVEEEEKIVDIVMAVEFPNEIPG